MPRARDPLETALTLLSLAPRHPRELYDRISGYADLALERLSAPHSTGETVSWEAALGPLETPLKAAPGRAARVLGERELLETERAMRRLLENIRGGDPFAQRWAADSLFARLCYLACRLLGPTNVVETGVAYGVSSAYILRALQKNGRGTLHSIDLPPLRRGYKDSWGVAVPQSLRSCWQLYRGSSRRVLPRLLEEIEPLDLFVHDSLHTRRNMAREFETVWPRLRPGGILLADDVERNPAFSDLRRHNPSFWRTVRDREKDPLHGRAAPVVFGIAVK